MRLVDWVLDRVWLLFVVLVVGVSLLFWQLSKNIDAECAEIMALARTPRDSLDAKVACSKIRSDAAIAAAIGFGAGAVAGSAASRR